MHPYNEKSELSVLFFQPTMPVYRARFFDHLAKAGVRFTVVAGQTVYDEGSPPTNVTARPWLRLCHVRRLMRANVYWHSVSKIVEEVRRVDVVVTFLNPRFLTSFSLLILARAFRKKVVWWGPFWGWSSSKRKLWLRLRLMSVFDALLVYTDREVRIARWIGVRQIIVATNNSNVLREELIHRQDLISSKTELGSAHIALFVGRDTTKSRLDWLIRLANEEDFRRVNFRVIGARTNRDRLAASNLTFCGEIYDEQELEQQFLDADVFVYPGSIGLSAIHALSYGLTVVTHNARRQHGAEHAVLYHRVNAYLFEYGSYESFKQMMLAICTNKIVLRSRAEVSRTVLPYTIDCMVSRVTTLLDELH